MRPHFWLALLLAGCATAPTIPHDRLACFAIEEYRQCVSITGEYRPEARRALGEGYCKRAAIGEAAKPYVTNWRGGYLWGCEK